MEINYDELLKRPEFNNLGPERKEALKNLALNLSGKNPTACMPVIAEFMKTMPKGGDLSKEEQNVMLKVMMEALPSEDKTKFINIMKMMDMLRLK